jgi:hypothetical protein
MSSKKLDSRQHGLKNYLERNFEKGRWFTVEELCGADLGYTLNTNPRTHHKCIAIWNDVKQLNWKTNVERYIPIITNERGEIKLCENEQELKDLIAKEEKKLEKASQYKNHLKSLIQIDGTCPCINLANRVLDIDEITPIDVYKKDTAQTTDQSK